MGAYESEPETAILKKAVRAGKLMNWAFVGGCHGQSHAKDL